ncbi:MAG: transposase [Planctomycetota bacterium]
MSRTKRIVCPGHFHHITQRGNNRQAIFLIDDDYALYLEWLRLRAAAAGVRIHAWCLMTNHVHVLATPMWEDSLADLFGPLHARFAQYIHRREGRVGHLFQARFYSCAADGDRAFDAVRYIELNPVRAGMVAHAVDYPHSSTRARIQNLTDPLLDRSWPEPGSISNWQEWLEEPHALPPTKIDEIRRSTRLGRRLTKE